MESDLDTNGSAADHRMSCPVCFTKIAEDLQSRELALYPDVDRPTLVCVYCMICQQDVLMRLDGKLKSIKQCMLCSTTQDAIVQAASTRDRILVYILSQVCHNQRRVDECDSDCSPFLPHPSTEFIRLFYQNGSAVGFYSVKLKGTPVHPMMFEMYSMPMLDTLFVCRTARGHGAGTRLVEDFLQQFPNQNVGFSQPLSNGLRTVLWRLLQQSPALRDYLWEISRAGGQEGDRCNVWFHLKREPPVQHI